MFYRLSVTPNASYEPGQRHFIAPCGESLCLLAFTDVRAASLDVVRSQRWFAPRGLESNSVCWIYKNHDQLFFCSDFFRCEFVLNQTSVLQTFIQICVSLKQSRFYNFKLPSYLRSMILFTEKFIQFIKSVETYKQRNMFPKSYNHMQPVYWFMFTGITVMLLYCCENLGVEDKPVFIPGRHSVIPLRLVPHRDTEGSL